MGKREKILIGLCVAGLIFLVFYTFLGQDKKNSVEKKPEVSVSTVQKFVDEQMIIMQKAQQLDRDKLIIKKAEENWFNDPFASAELIRQIEGYAENEKTPMEINREKQEPLLYSGYIKVGKKLLAIVNGMEYEKGETIEGTSYEVFSVSIATESIMLRSPDSTIKTVYLSDETDAQEDRRKNNI